MSQEGIPQHALARRFWLKAATGLLALALIAAILIVWRGSRGPSTQAVGAVIVDCPSEASA